MSTQENTIKNDELDLSSATEVYTQQNVILRPGQKCYIPLYADRNYHLIVLNGDDAFDLVFMVKYNFGLGSETLIIQPGKQFSIPLNSASEGVLLGNVTVPSIPGRPAAVVSIYTA